MKKRILVVASVAALVIGATVFALGHSRLGIGQHERGKGRGHGDMLEHMARELNLTDTQKQQVKEIMDAAESSTEATRTKLDDIRKQLDAATANGQFDETQVRNLASQKAQLEADMMVEHLRAKSKVFSILTAEQRTKAEELHKRGGPHGHRRGPPPPPPSE